MQPGWLPYSALSNRNCLVCLSCPLSELVPHSPFRSASRTLPGAHLRRRVQGSARGRGGGSRHLLLLALSRWRSLFLSLTTSVSSQSCKISEFFFFHQTNRWKTFGFWPVGKEGCYYLKGKFFFQFSVIHVKRVFLLESGLKLVSLSGYSGSDGEASACNAGDPGSIPGSGRSTGEGNGNPLQYSCLENPKARGAGWASVHVLAKIRTQLSN